MFYSIIVGLIGGMGLFLYGIKMMSSGMERAAGDKLRRILEILTSNHYIATLTGIVVTVLVQSSSTTNVMVVGFANAGLMTLSQAVGTMLGANIGTTITAQIISFDFNIFVYPVIGGGAILHLFGKKRLYKHIGQGILGFGILFLGLSTMSNAMNPLREYPPFISMLASFGSKPLLGVLVGAIFTALIQSSSATAGVVIALTLQGIIDTPSSIAIVLGANIGTSITAALASVGTNLTARRAVLCIILVKFVGVITALIFFKPFVNVISYTGSSVTRQVANAHTIFNILNVLVFYPVLNPFLKFITKLIPGEVTVVETGTKYLNQQLLRTTSLAIGAARKELLRMAYISRDILKYSIRVFSHYDSSLADHAAQKEDLIDKLEKDIIIYLTEIAQGSINEQQSRWVTGLMHGANDVERIGDHSYNIIQLAEVKMEENLQLSAPAKVELEDFYAKVDFLLEKAIIAFENEDVELAKEVIKEHSHIYHLERSVRKNHIARLNQKKCLPEAGVVYLDAINSFERIASHATNLAKVVTGEF